jgi:hypothetical protein
MLSFHRLAAPHACWRIRLQNRDLSIARPLGLVVALYKGVDKTARRGQRKYWKKVGLILLTVAFVIVPMGGLMLVIYGGVRRLGKRKRDGSGPVIYAEWLALRSFARSQTVGRLSRARHHADSGAARA